MEKTTKVDRFSGFEPEVRIFSPGRINLIGEHTDYNEGFVLPTAIQHAVRVEMRRNGSDGRCTVYSRTIDRSFTFELGKITRSPNDWENFILGVVSEIQTAGKTLSGFDCLIESELPTGAGMSSSAALECGVAFGLDHLFKLGMDRKTLATLCRDAEHNYVGTRCGIMDQFASMLSRQGNLMLLDCRSMDIDFVPVDFSGYQILLLNTGVSHNLAGSEYNKRREECEAAVERLQQNFPGISSLRDVDLAMLESQKELLSEVQFSRAHYVISENQRVLRAVKAIRERDIATFGNLMYQSHQGLQYEYEVSCQELDFLVDHARESGLVLGSRMMGGGFGGCTINLIRKEDVDSFKHSAMKTYEKTFGFAPVAIPVALSGGTSLTSLK